MIEYLFFLSLFAIFFSYFGYPITLYMIGLFRQKQVKRENILPNISLIITVYNEEKRIVQKLENTMRLDYPDDKLEIIFASDGSTDKTNDIIKKMGNDKVYLLEISERKGKEHAQSKALNIANGEIIVFSDAATILDVNSLRRMASNFSDPSIGCVSSEDMIIGEDGKVGGESLYVKYEMWLRRLESRVNSLVGLSGSFFAARKEICDNFSTKMQSDFRILLNCIQKGQRGISDDRVIGYYQHYLDEKQEQDRKVRTIIRGLTVFFNNLQFLNVLKYGIFSYQYFCHKLLRWLVPLFMICAFITNLIIAIDSNIFRLLFLFHISFYCLGMISLSLKPQSSNPLLKIPQYFINVNYSILIAWVKLIKGERVVKWQPTRRD